MIFVTPSRYNSPITYMNVTCELFFYLLSKVMFSQCSKSYDSCCCVYKYWWEQCPQEYLPPHFSKCIQRAVVGKAENISNWGENGSGFCPILTAMITDHIGLQWMQSSFELVQNYLKKSHSLWLQWMWTLKHTKVITKITVLLLK